MDEARKRSIPWKVLEAKDELLTMYRMLSAVSAFLEHVKPPHIFARSSLSSSKPCSRGRLAGDSQRETLGALVVELYEGTTVLCSITIHKISHFTVSAPQRNPHDGRQFATARTSAMATIDALDRFATITRETQTSVSTHGMLCGSQRCQIDAQYRLIPICVPKT